MDWFVSLLRIAGSSFPLSASIVQLSAEIDSVITTERLNNLEDPISNYHEDIPDITKLFYNIITNTDSNEFNLKEEEYQKYKRVLGVLESKNFISIPASLAKQFPQGIKITDPSYILYMCALHEDPEKMDGLSQMIEKCPAGKNIDGYKVKENINLPLPAIKAMFEIYESKNYGLCSKTIGVVKYIGN